MSTEPRHRKNPLTVDTIVETARKMIADQGLGALSMRRLGAELGVDPMAVYHHVPNKQVLLSLVTAHLVGSMDLPGADEPWDLRVRMWAGAYWDVVVAYHQLIAATLADPVIAAGAIPLVAPLEKAIADSGLDQRHLEANVWLVVDFVHGAALGASALSRSDDGRDALRRAFESGLETITAGITALTARPPGWGNTGESAV